MERDELGTVVTFYSFKGGVGRSFLLANVATILANWGYRVLCIDFDLEAPGLEHYFSEYLTAEDQGRQIPITSDLKDIFLIDFCED